MAGLIYLSAKSPTLINLLNFSRNKLSASIIVSTSYSSSVCASKDPAVIPASCSNCIRLRIASNYFAGGTWAHVCIRSGPISCTFKIFSTGSLDNSFFNCFQWYYFSSSSTCPSSSQPVIFSSSSTYLIDQSNVVISRFCKSDLVLQSCRSDLILRSCGSDLVSSFFIRSAFTIFFLDVA